jgi:large subunit ribosomal protein L22
MTNSVTGERSSAGRAQAKFVRVSPRKARLVVDHIRGRSVPEARTILAFTSRAVALDVEKVLRSAVANAEVAAGRPIGDDLVVAAAFVDEGPTIKRWRARARGRAGAIKKRTCHITIHVAEKPYGFQVETDKETGAGKRSRRRKKEATA